MLLNIRLVCAIYLLHGFHGKYIDLQEFQFCFYDALKKPRNAPLSDEKQYSLSHIYRHQRFYVWLCALNCISNELIIFQTIRWWQTIEIIIEPNLPAGKRAKLVSHSKPIQPIFLKQNLLIPSCALKGPSVNFKRTQVK